MRDLDDVSKQGAEVTICGELWENLSFNLGYVYQDWDYDGQHTEAAEELSDRAHHRIKAGFRYRFLENTVFMLDYAYQSEQVEHIQKEEPPDSGHIISYENYMDSYHVFDAAIEHTLPVDSGYLKELGIKVYVENLFNEDYEQARGYPMTDRTFGCAVSCSF